MNPEYALNYKGSSWITAHAGSGKTYVLARRVVRLLVDGAAPEHILCLTYTNAAAAEMRARILDLLAVLWRAEDVTREKILGEMLGEAPNIAQLARAVRLYPQVLASPAGGMTITTLHGFAQQLIRSFPLEAGLLPHVSLLEEHEASALKVRAIRQLYRTDAARDPALALALSDVSALVAEGRLEEWCHHLMDQSHRFRSALQFPDEASLRAAIFALAPSPYIRADDWNAALVNELPAATESALREVGNYLVREGSKSFSARAEQWLAWLALSPAARIVHAEDYRACWLTEKAGALKNILPVKPYGAEHPLTRIFKIEQARVLENYQGFANHLCLEESYEIALIARALLELYAAAKFAAGRVDYEDMIQKTGKMMSDEALLPWILSRLDYRIDHILLDEAQDTSAAQWRIATALISELMATPTPDGMARQLLVVGDVKQSIYSFQGAAPEEFDRMRGEMMEVLRGAPAPIMAQTLSASYRSTQPILILAGRLCEHLALANGDHNHRLTREGAAGRVELWPLVAQSEKPERLAYTIPTTYVDAMRAEETLAANIAATIRGWLDTGRLLEARGRAVTPGDILILVWRRSPFMPLLIRALEAQQIPVAGLDRLALSSHLAVRDLMALMRVVTAPEDDLALAQLLRSPLGNFSEEELYTLAHGRSEDETLWTRLTSHPFRVKIESWRNFATSAQPYAFLMQILEREGYRRDFARRFSSEVHEVLDALLDHAAGLTESLSLFAYEQLLAREAREIKREAGGQSERNQLRIMTVHGAKGLEAPIVILPDTTRVPGLQQELSFDMEGAAVPLVALSQDAKLAPLIAAAKAEQKERMMREYARLLYVAVTRAADELYIGGVKSGKSLPEHCWYSTIESVIKTIPEHEEMDGTLRLSTPQIRSVMRAPEIVTTISPLPDWALYPAPSETRRRSFSPSRLMDQELTLYQSRDSGARSRGVTLHRWLECATQMSSADNRRDYLERLTPDWSEEARAEALAEMERLLATSELGWIWQERGYNEVSITGTVEIAGVRERFHGQIDRLVMRGNQIVILDYKTAVHPPASVADTPLAYLLQMKAYQQLFANKYSNKEVRCALLWTTLPRLDWLDKKLADTHWQHTMEAA